MSDYYSVEVRVTFGILAESEDAAEAIARQLVQIDEAPDAARITYEARLTINQSDSIKRCAVNK